MRGLSFLNKILFLINSICVFLLLLACAVPYISLAQLSFLSFLGLAVPILVILNIVFLLYWLLLRRKQFLLSLFILIFGYVVLGSFVEFRLKEKTIGENDISVMSFNSKGFEGYGRSKGIAENTKKIIDFIELQNPDIICFQEYDYKMLHTDDFSSYPYNNIDYDYYDNNRVLQAIFSKYPIVSKGILEFSKSSNSAMFANVLINGDTVRVYNLHLESFNIRPGNITKEDSEKLFNRLSLSFGKQEQQAEIFKQHSQSWLGKKIVCGDFNNTQFSRTYKIIKGDMLDSFGEKGTGYGRTIKFWHFPFRIDFILADKSFEVKAHKNFKLRLSDHEPVMASFRLKNQ